MKQQKNDILRGFSLVECCITLVLISALLCILMQQYLQVKQQYGYTNAALDEAIEVQLAIDFIRDRIRHAGFTPCRGLSHLIVSDTRLKKVDMTAWRFLANDLICRRMDGFFSQAFVSKPHAMKIKLSKPLKLTIGQSVMIADCVHAEIQTIENIDVIGGHQYLTLRKPLFFEYSSPFYLGLWIEEHFWIKPNSRHESSLMYQKEHADVLTPYIQRIEASHSEGMIHLKCELKQHKVVNIDVRLRIN